MALAYQAYEDDLCPGCGWPRTYSTHKGARGHWSGSNAIICHGCEAKGQKEQAASKSAKQHLGAHYVARPDEGMWHAMSDPILTYDATFNGVGASGIDYSTTDDQQPPGGGE